MLLGDLESQKWYAETDDLTISRKRDIDGGVFRFEVERKGHEPWRPQLFARPIAFEEGLPYTFSIQARAETPTRVNIGARRAEGDFANLGFAGTMDLTPDWQTFEYTFAVNSASPVSRFDIGNLQAGVNYEFRNSSLRPGGSNRLPERNTLRAGTIPLIDKDGFTHPTDPNEEPIVLPRAARNDFCEFLFEIERTYWLGMYRFLKEELGVKQPISGTQIYYGSTTIQSELDYADVHVYWNHPTFPGRPWDMSNWLISNRALVDYLDRDVLPRMATARPHGKPYTISEFDAAFPNQFAAEALPIIAAFGRFQDWDGFFHFAYSHSKDTFEPRMALGFFDMAGHTTKLVHQPACVAMFVRRDVRPAESLVLGRFDPATELELFQRVTSAWNFNFSNIGMDPRLTLFHRTGLDVTGRHTPQQHVPSAPNNIDRIGEEMFWFRPEGRQGRRLMIDTENTKVFTGFHVGRDTFNFDGVELQLGNTRLNWATISMVSINGNGFAPAKAQGQPIRILVAATGLMQNTNMQLEQRAGNQLTYGTQSGTAPTMCEGIPFTLQFENAQEVRAYPLDERGNRMSEISAEGNRTMMGPEYQTVWYEMELR